MEDQEATTGARVEGRRSLLKKAAVVGGAAWIAPTLLSQPASAQGSEQGSQPCANCTPVSAGTTTDVGCGAIVMSPGTSTPGGDIYSLQPITNPAGPPTITCVSLVSGGSSLLVNTGLPTSGQVALVVQNPTGPATVCVSFSCPD